MTSPTARPFGRYAHRTAYIPGLKARGFTRNIISQLMRITINDSVYSQPDLLFTQRGSLQQRGWQTVLIPGNLRTGKNTIRIGLQKDSLAKPEEITTIPFWYVPDK